MKLKPKGRKIYRQKKPFERFRVFLDNTTAVVSALLLVAVLVFVGYSAGAPILQFLQEKEILKPPQNTAEISSIPDNSPDVPQNEPVVSHSTDVHAEVIDETQPPETEPPTEPPMEIPEIRGWLLDTSDLATEQDLQKALENVPEMITHVMLPLKVSGGDIYYATNSGSPNAVKAAVPLNIIYQTVAERGFEPVAVVNLLEDSVYSVKNPDASYLLDDGTFWKDAFGNSYLSPFSILTADYLSGISAEIEQSGFTQMICEGLLFPQFPERDLSHLDAQCSASDRYTALVDIVQSMQNAAPDIDFYVQISGEAVLSNQTATLSAADHLDLEAIFVTVNTATLPEVNSLREISEEHPCILEWLDVELPENEKSYILSVHSSNVEPENNQN
ncbi:MAG: putative glycoside hydrolase [Oscillospiraceae bacterium]